MKIIAKGKRFKCPDCGTVVDLGHWDIHNCGNLEYYTCPTCNEDLIIKYGDITSYILKPWGMNKKAIPM